MKGRKQHSHLANGRVCDGAADLDGDDEVHRADGDLEGLEADVLVGEDPVLRGFHRVVADGDTGGDGVVGVWAEPGVALGLLEDVVQEGIVSVVIHRSLGLRGGVTLMEVGE